MKILNLVIIVFALTVQAALAGWYNQNQGEVNQFTNIVKNGTITSLVTTSNQGYFLTGAATQVIKLPDATTLPQDWAYHFVNTSSGVVTIRDYQDNDIGTVDAGRSSTFLLRTKSTGAGTWYQVSNAVSGSSSAIDYNSFSATAPLTYNGSGVYGIPVASGSSDGYLSAADWNTFNSIPSTFSATAPLLYNGAGLYSIPQASGTTDGYLSASDWTMFNNSATGNFITDLTGDVTATGPNSAVATIANNAVTDGKFRQSAGLSVVGRSSNSTGDVADITAAADGDVLRRSGTTLDFGDVTYASLPQLSAYRVFGNPTGSTADAQDSTLTSLFDGAFSSSVGSILYRGAATWDALAPGTAGRALVSGGSGAPSYYTPTVGSVLFAGTGGVLSERNNSFFWDDTNLRLGIGTTAPGSALDVAGVPAGTNYQIQSRDNTAMVAGVGGGMTLLGVATSGGGYGRMGGIKSVKENGISADYSAALTFLTPTSSGNDVLTEKMRISSAGNVGIGTSSPTQMLDVQKSVDGQLQLKVSNSSATANAYTEILANNGTVSTYLGSTNQNYGSFSANRGYVYNNGTNAGLDLATETNGDIRLYTNGYTSAANERMRITSAGNVGIGTTTPAAKLDVSNSAAGATFDAIHVSNSGSGANTQAALKFLAASTEYGNIIGGYGPSKPEMSFNLPSASGGNFIWSSNSIERMRISSSGNVGVATTSPGSTFHVAGSFQTKVNSVSANTTLDATYHTVLVDDSGATRTITLPPCASTIFGREYRIKKMSASNTTVIDGDASETIDGATTVTLSTQYSSRDVVCTSAGAWSIF